MERSQLKYPADSESIKAIETASDSFLLNKIANLEWDKFIRFSDYFSAPAGTSVANSGYLAQTNGTASAITNDSTQLALSAGMASGALASVSKKPLWVPFLTYLAPSYFRTGIATDSTFNIRAYVMQGATGTVGYGFKVINHTLNGMVVDSASGTESTVRLVNSTFTNLAGDSTTLYSLAAKFFPGNKCIFYVNGLESGSIPSTDAHFPISTQGVPETNLFEAYVSTTTTVTTTKSLFLSYIDILQFKQNASQQ